MVWRGNEPANLAVAHYAAVSKQPRVEATAQQQVLVAMAQQQPPNVMPAYGADTARGAQVLEPERFMDVHLRAGHATRHARATGTMHVHVHGPAGCLRLLLLLLLRLVLCVGVDGWARSHCWRCCDLAGAPQPAMAAARMPTRVRTVGLLLARGHW
jgi:hypothetical protein